eukprot:g2369.t1
MRTINRLQNDCSLKSREMGTLRAKYTESTRSALEALRKQQAEEIRQLRESSAQKFRVEAQEMLERMKISEVGNVSEHEDTARKWSRRETFLESEIDAIRQSQSTEITEVRTFMEDSHRKEKEAWEAKVKQLEVASEAQEVRAKAAYAKAKATYKNEAMMYAVLQRSTQMLTEKVRELNRELASQASVRDKKSNVAI